MCCDRIYKHGNFSQLIIKFSAKAFKSFKNVKYKSVVKKELFKKLSNSDGKYNRKKAKY